MASLAFLCLYLNLFCWCIIWYHISVFLVCFCPCWFWSTTKGLEASTVFWLGSFFSAPYICWNPLSFFTLIRERSSHYLHIHMPFFTSSVRFPFFMWEDCYATTAGFLKPIFCILFLFWLISSGSFPIWLKAGATSWWWLIIFWVRVGIWVSFISM